MEFGFNMPHCAVRSSRIESHRGQLRLSRHAWTIRTLNTAAPKSTRPNAVARQNKYSAAAEMGDRAGAKWAENSGLFPWGELGPHLTQCGRGRGLSSCLVSSRSI